MRRLTLITVWLNHTVISVSLLYGCICYTSTNLRTLAACDIVLMDGTFKSCPRFFMQLYTIFGYANHCYLPLVYGLLSNKEQSTYQRFLRRVTIAQCVSIYLVFEPSAVLTDFEKAAMNAVSTVLPASRLHGCRFHLEQSWWRRIQALDLSEDYKVEPCAAPVAPPPPNFFTPRRRRNFWPAPAQIGGVAENATVAERQSMIFLSTMW